MNRVQTLVNKSNRESRMAAVARDVNVLLESGDVMVTVSEFVPRGTLDQNALFHKLCDHVANWWNARHPQQMTSPEAVKRDLKVKFGLIHTEYSPVTGNRAARLASWSEYTKRQRSDLISNTLAWMFENGIPDLPEIAATEYAGMREAAA